MDINARVTALESTTFCGRRFSRIQILQIAKTVTDFPNLSRTELAQTLCEHFDWGTATSQLKVNSALDLLDKLESLAQEMQPVQQRHRVRAAGDADKDVTAFG